MQNAKKGVCFAIFDTIDVRKNFVEINGVRYPKVSIDIDFATNFHLDQHRDPKTFHKEYVGELQLNPFKGFPYVENFHPTQVIDLRVHVDHKNPQKIQFFEENGGDLADSRRFIVLVRHRETKMVSAGDEITETQVIYREKSEFIRIHEKTWNEK